MTLHDAVRRGEIATIRSLISQGAHLDEQEANEYGWIPLHLATRDIAVVDLLLASGADPNATNRKGETALVQARGNLSESDSAKNLEVVRLLLSKGAQVNAQNENSSTALLLAVVDYQVDLAKLLLDCGADPELKDSRGRSPLHYLVYSYSSEKDTTKSYTSSTDHESYYAKLRAIFDALVAHGADVSSADNEGNRPLHTAAKYGCSEMAQILLQRGARIEDKNSFGSTAYIIAVQNGRAEMAAFFGRNGASTQDATDPSLIAKDQAAKRSAADAQFEKDAVECPGCHQRFIWKQAFKQQDTPGSYGLHPPGHGDFRPRVFCPHCGVMVAEWDIDRSADHNRWRWHGDFGKVNPGRPLPPSPLLAWGKSIHPEARSQPHEDRINLALNESLWSKEAAKSPAGKSKPMDKPSGTAARVAVKKTAPRPVDTSASARKKGKKGKKRIMPGHCAHCGEALGFLDRLWGRTSHRRCQSYPK